jgi:hypothetical protein
MDTNVTIGENNYSLTSQQPTGNVRSGLASSVPTRIVTNHMEQAPKGGTPVIRTVRKVEQTVTTSVGGVAVALPVSASLTVTVPTVLAASTIDGPLGVLAAWMAQANFAADIKNRAI